MNSDVEQKLNEYLDRGLCDGMGEATGQVCIEAAIALATEGKLKDSPACVHAAVRAFSIKLNDAEWSTKRARADGLRALAFAQLGTADTLDGNRFAAKLAELTIRRVLPISLRAANLIEVAERCERGGDAAAEAYDNILRVSAQCAVEAIAFGKQEVS